MDVSEENHYFVQKPVQFLIRPLLVARLELSVNILGYKQKKRTVFQCCTTL